MGGPALCVHARGRARVCSSCVLAGKWEARACDSQFIGRRLHRDPDRLSPTGHVPASVAYEFNVPRASVRGHPTPLGDAQVACQSAGDSGVICPVPGGTDATWKRTFRWQQAICNEAVRLLCAKRMTS